VQVYNNLLINTYDRALLETGYNDFTTTLSGEVKEQVELLVSRSETNKGLIAVLITLLVYKHVNPMQDIRYHQASLPNGFAGRTIDQRYITPFMKRMCFPAMAESGWLTRSLEQAHPYDLDYPGKITPKVVKVAFLNIINQVQVNSLDAIDVLFYFFKLLIKQRNELNIELAKPHSLPISKIIILLEKHFTYRYSCAGASRLPSLAIYAAYQCMMNQVARFRDKQLCPLASHSSADAQSGRIGDIDVNNENGTAFEGVEIKHGIKITPQHIRDAYEKFKVHNTDRYYLLTTADMDSEGVNEIEIEVQRVAQIHGCQVIVNGVYSTIKYYLRLVTDTAEFIDKYVELLKSDETIKFQHKIVWNDIVSQGL